MTTLADGMVAANGINIHYYRTAGGSGKAPLLLLHGVTDNGLCWTRVALDLADRFDVIMTDARGHGQSDRLAGEFSVPLLAEDAPGVIEALGLERPVVYGHSMGAITAVALAAEHPQLVRAVILEDPPLRTITVRVPAGFMEQRHRELMALRGITAEQRRAAGAAQNPGWHRLEVGPWAESKAEVDLAVTEHIGTFDRYPWREGLTRLRCPGLLITADPDKMAIVTPEVAYQVPEMWPQSEVVQIKGAGHSIHRERYEEVMAAVDAFLKRQGIR